MRRGILISSVLAFLLGAFVGFTRILEVIPWLISGAGDPMKLLIPEITTYNDLRTKGAILTGILFAAPFVSLAVFRRSPAWRLLLLYSVITISVALVTGWLLHALYRHVGKVSEQVGASVFFSLRSVLWEWIPATGSVSPIGIAYLLRHRKRSAGVPRTLARR